MAQTLKSSSQFNPALFWDIQPELLDTEVHARFIIGRVLSLGDFADWEQLKNIFGQERIKREALQIRSLDKKTVCFLSVYFCIKKTEFRCYS